jgi:uncharacterized sodium:solute symporter family permease YidK
VLIKSKSNEICIAKLQVKLLILNSIISFNSTELISRKIEIFFNYIYSMIINQEEKFQLIFDKLKEKQTEQSMFNKFLEMYPTEWKQLKVTFSKFNRSKQFGKTIPLPKPEQSLRKEIRVWLKRH